MLRPCSALLLALVGLSLGELLGAPRLAHLAVADDASGEPGAQEDAQLAKLEWWKKTNYYHIYLRSFKDTTGDGNGDLRGVIEKLDYLKQIGVETILMAPFYSSPMKDCGYDIDDYLAVNPMFGSLDDFDELVRQVKRRGMRIVVDFVPNHSSNKHPWFECSERALLEPERCGKYKDYYIWTDIKRYQSKLPSNWISVFGGGPAWTWSEVRGAFYLHQFLPEQPDLNFRSAAVRDEFKQIARFWLERGADGLRVDSAIYLIEHDFAFGFPDEPANSEWRPGQDPADRLLHEHTRCLHESAEIVADWRQVAAEFGEAAQKVIITEAYDKIPKLIEYYGRSPAERYADLPFNFELLKLDADSMADAGPLEQVALNWLRPTRALGWPDELGAMSPWIIWVTANHDNQRPVNKVGPGRLALFKWFTYLLPGVPVNYYGDELPLHDANFNSIPKRTIDEGEPTRLPFRAPMAWTAEQPSAGFSSSREPWMPPNANFEQVNVQRLLSAESEPKNELKLFVALQQLRKRKLGLFAFGDLQFFQASALPDGRRQVLAAARTHPSRGNLLLLANLNTHQQVTVTNLSASQEASLVFGRAPVAAPNSGTIVLTNLEQADKAPLVKQGAQVQLDGLVLAPGQALFIEF